MPEYRALYTACTSLPVIDLLAAVAQCRGGDIIAGDNSIPDVFPFTDASAQRMASIDYTVTATYISRGCWNDGSDGPADRDMGSVDANGEGVVTDMAGQSSVSTCAQVCLGYEHFAVQNGNQCYCDNSFGTHGRDTSHGGCNVPCANADNLASATPENCGGDWRNSVYDATTTEMDDLVVDNSIRFNREGCYIDTEHRDLIGDVIHMGADASEQACATLCAGNGFEHFGLQYMHECFCGNTYGNQ